MKQEGFLFAPRKESARESRRKRFHCEKCGKRLTLAQVRSGYWICLDCDRKEERADGPAN